MPRFRRRADNPDEVAQLRAEVAGMAARLAAADAAAEARAERADRARQSLAQFSSPAAAATATPTATAAPTATPLPADPPPPIARAADLDALRDELATQVAALDARLQAIDARITAVTTELANQLAELGAESDIPGDTAVALRQAQTRLANEQARYQIAFRDDLARLAEQIRKR